MVCGDWEYNYSTYEYTDCDQAGTNNFHYTQYEGQDSGQILSNLPPGASGNAGSSNVITNLIKDPCLSKTVNEALSKNKGLKDAIAGIIANFDASKKVKLSISDGETDHNTPGQTKGAIFRGDQFSADIILQTSYFYNSSKVSVISILIHEFVRRV